MYVFSQVMAQTVYHKNRPASWCMCEKKITSATNQKHCEQLILYLILGDQLETNINLHQKHSTQLSCMVAHVHVHASDPRTYPKCVHNL